LTLGTLMARRFSSHLLCSAFVRDMGDFVSGGVLALGMAVVVDAQPRGCGHEADELGIGCLMV